MKRAVFFLCCFMMCLLALPATAIEIEDIAGNVLKVPPYPRRIVSLAPSITECLFSIGCGDRVVGVTLFSDYPPQVKKLPRVGSYIQPNIEKILALRPDLCLATKDGNPRSLVMKLKEVGVDVFVVDPRDIDSLFDTMLVLGRLTGCYIKALEVVNRLKKQVKEVEKRSRTFFRHPRVFFQIGVDPMVTVGSHTLIDNLITLAGGINIFSGRFSYPRVSVEQVIARQPDIIVITSMVNSRPNLQRLKEFWFQYGEIPAVKKGNIFVVNSDYFNRPSPRAVEGLRILSKLFEKVMESRK